MTVLSQSRPVAVLLAYTFALLAPALAIRAGLLSFDLRFQALVIVSSLCVAQCALAGYSLADLGLARSGSRRHWLGSAVVTLFLIGGLCLEARFLDFSRAPPDLTRFAPFYVLVSSPFQEIVCRAIPKIIADRLGASGLSYVLYSSLVFSFLHAAYDDHLLLINTFFAGLAWSATYLATGAVWPLAASHAAVGMFAFWLGAA